MRTTRLFLGVIAFVFAFASAFAFKSASVAANPAYLDDGVCTQVEASCIGDDIPCQVNLGGQIGVQAIYDKQTTSCTQLEMSSN